MLGLRGFWLAQFLFPTPTALNNIAQGKGFASVARQTATLGSTAKLLPHSDFGGFAAKIGVGDFLLVISPQGYVV